MALLLLLPAGAFGWHLWLLLVRGVELKSERDARGFEKIVEVPVSRKTRPVAYWSGFGMSVAAIAGLVFLGIWLVQLQD